MTPGPAHKNSHELTTDQTTDRQTQQKNPEHAYLKFLTPLTPSVEKTVKNAMGSSKFINKEI